MNILIYDFCGQKLLANWSKGEFCNLTYRLERIGGMISASFDVKVEYAEPYEWCGFWNQVEIYYESVLVFAGYLHDLSRFWNEKESGIRAEVSGWVAKLAKDYTTANLSNEQASDYIIDHILAGELANWISAGEIDTSDFLIPGELEYKPRKTKRHVMDELLEYNADTHEWGVWGKEFYWKRQETQLAYRTTIRDSVGSLRQGIGEFGNNVIGDYRDEDGAWQSVTETDSDSPYPTEYVLETYPDNMTSAQATQRAKQSLERVNRLGANAPITIKRVWGKSGSQINPREIKPGKIIEIGGMVPGQASIADADVDNDLDTFMIESVQVDDETGFAEVSPGKLPYTLLNVIAGR